MDGEKKEFHVAKIMEIIEKETRGKAITHISIAMILSVCLP